MIILGLLFVIAGFMIIVGKFTDVPIYYYLEMYWPAILVVLGIHRIAVKKGSMFVNLMLVGFGTVMLLGNIRYYIGDYSELFLAVILVSLGISMLTKKKGVDTGYTNDGTNGGSKTSFGYDYDRYGIKREDVQGEYHYSYNDQQNNTDEQQQAHEGDNEDKNFETHEDFKKTNHDENVHYNNRDTNYIKDASDIIHSSYNFTSKKVIYNSQTFSGGDITSMFSDITIDLRNTRPLDYVTELEIKSYFSTVTIMVPKDWHVLYGIKNTNTDDKSSFILKVRESGFFGNVNVI